MCAPTICATSADDTMHHDPARVGVAEEATARRTMLVAARSTHFCAPRAREPMPTRLSPPPSLKCTRYLYKRAA